VSCGELGEKDKALNLVEIIADKSSIRIRINDFQLVGLTRLNMALMLLRRMVPSAELRK